MDGPTPALWLGHSVTRRVQQQWRRRSASSAAAGEVFAATDSLTAEEYLLHVRWQAKALPQVVVADVQASATRVAPAAAAVAAAAAVSTSAKRRREPASTPSKAWRDSVIGDFVDVRQVISRARALIEDGKPQAPPPQNLPAKENSAAWMQLLLSTHPSIAALAYYEQGLLRRLLERVTYEWTRDNSFSPQMCMWTYALLAALEVGQPARLIAMLRVLLQRCLRVVDASPRDAPLHSGATLVCTIIGCYFGQRDLLPWE